MSMCARQIHLPLRFGQSSSSGAGWGSWMTTTSAPSSGVPQLGDVCGIDVGIDAPVLFAQGDGFPLQAVVNGFRDAEKGRRPADHLPRRVDAELLHEGHHPGQDLGHASPLRRGVDVDDPEPPEFFPQPLHLADGGQARDIGIGFQGMAHCFLPLVFLVRGFEQPSTSSRLISLSE